MNPVILLPLSDKRCLSRRQQSLRLLHTTQNELVMTLGPGKYQELCTKTRIEARAIGAIVMIIEGRHGNGFSCQAPLEVQRELPTMLRELAHSIEETFVVEAQQTISA